MPARPPALLRRHPLSSSIQQVSMLACLGWAVTTHAQDATELAQVTVTGTEERLPPQVGSTATKSSMSLLQTPAATVVIDRELLDSQGAQTLQDSIRNISGISQAGNNYGIGDNLVIRGLGVNYALDGMYAGGGLGNTYNPTRSMLNIDRVEVLKGPATGLYGIGEAGGVINLIEKQPQSQARTEVSANAGRWNEWGLSLDTTAPINDALAYRLVAGHQQSDGYRGLSSERSEAYGSVRWQLNAHHQLRLQMAYIGDSVQIDSVGHPVRIMNWDSTLATPGRIDASDLPNDADGDADGSLGLQLTDEQRQQLADSVRSSDGLEPYDLGSASLISPLSEPNEGTEQRVKLIHEWHGRGGWSLVHQLQQRSYESEFVRQTGAYNYVYWNRRGEINADPRAPLVVDGELYPYAIRRQEYRRQVVDEDNWQYFADITKSWNLGTWSGEHLLSLYHDQREIKLKSWSAYDADGGSGSNPIPYILDMRDANWPSGDFMDYDHSLRSHYNKELIAQGVSAQEVFYWAERLTARFGLAHTRLEQRYQHLGTDRSPQATPEADTRDAGNTFNAGLNYRWLPQLATFANFAKGRTAYSILDSVNGEDDRPDSESQSLDIGLRWAALAGRVTGSLVWFDTRRTNLRYANPEYNDNPEDDEYNVDVRQYFYDDEDKTRGYELDLALALAERWQLTMNATYQKAEQVRKGENLGQVKGIPKRFASVWGRYSLPLSQLPAPVTLALGVQYEDKRTINSSSFGVDKAVVPEYTRFDAAVSYDYEQLALQLNVHNLTNETYYSKPMFLGGQPGDPRNVSVSTKYRF